MSGHSSYQNHQSFTVEAGAAAVRARQELEASPSAETFRKVWESTPNLLIGISGLLSEWAGTCCDEQDEVDSALRILRETIHGVLKSMVTASQGGRSTLRSLCHGEPTTNEDRFSRPLSKGLPYHWSTTDCRQMHTDMGLIETGLRNKIDPRKTFKAIKRLEGRILSMWLDWQQPTCSIPIEEVPIDDNEDLQLAEPMRESVPDTEAVSEGSLSEDDASVAPEADPNIESSEWEYVQHDSPTVTGSHTYTLPPQRAV